VCSVHPILGRGGPKPPDSPLLQSKRGHLSGRAPKLFLPYFPIMAFCNRDRPLLRNGDFPIQVAHKSTDKRSLALLVAISQVVPNGDVTDTEGLPHQLRRYLLVSPAHPQRGTTPRVVRQAPVRLPSSRSWRTSQGLVIVGRRFRPLAVPVPNEQTRLSASPLAAPIYNALPLPNLRGRSSDTGVSGFIWNAF
jgi:hypothetical protein